MAHGPETDALLRKISNCDHKLDVSYMRITSIPKIPSHVRILRCHNTKITELPTLPDKLEELICHETPLKIIPKLPDSLRYLSCNDTKITKLPELPIYLQYLSVHDTEISSLPKLPFLLENLYCFNTQITLLPELPKYLYNLACHNSNLLIRRLPGEALQDYVTRWNHYHEEVSRIRIQKRNKIIWPDLCAYYWHPSHVENMLAQGGWDSIDF